MSVAVSRAIFEAKIQQQRPQLALRNAAIQQVSNNVVVSETHSTPTRCFNGHVMQPQVVKGRKQRCAICLVRLPEGSNVEACGSGCEHALCHSCSPLPMIGEVESLFPVDRTIYVSSFHCGNTVDIRERLTILLESQAKSSVRQVAVRADLGRAWVVFDTNAGRELFTKNGTVRSGEIDLFDGASASWEIYSPSDVRKVYEIANCSLDAGDIRQLMGQMDIPSANIDLVINQDNDRVLIVFSRPESDLATGDVRILFDEEFNEYTLRETKGTIRSRRTQSLPTKKPTLVQTQVERSSSVSSRVASTATSTTTTSSVARSVATKSLECPICTETCSKFVSLQVKGATCSSTHPICEDCARRAVEVKIESMTGLDHISCPCGTCGGGVLQYRTIRDLISKSNPKLFDQYVKHGINMSLEGSAKFRWCSNPICGSAQTVTETSGAWTCRSCGYRTCVAHDRPAFTRILVPHAHGGLVAAEEEKNSACCVGFLEDTKMHDRLSSKWIAENAKDCPKCKVPIQKNLGCRHMTCTHCRHEFFWCCLRSYRDETEAKLHRKNCPD
jgi:hypothetical protein